MSGPAPIATHVRSALGGAALLLLFALIGATTLPTPAGAQSVLDRMRERAASQAETQTEAEANERVDSAVDKTVDCVFNPVACAKQTPAATPPAGAPAAGAADASQWYAEQNGNRVGPMPRSQLDAMVAGGQLNASSLVWRVGMAAWTAAGQVAELADAFKKVPPPLPSRSGPPPLPSASR